MSPSRHPSPGLQLEERCVMGTEARAGQRPGSGGQPLILALPCSGASLSSLFLNFSALPSPPPGPEGGSQWCSSRRALGWAHYQVKPRHHPGELGSKLHGCLDGFRDGGRIFGPVGEMERSTGAGSSGPVGVVSAPHDQSGLVQGTQPPCPHDPAPSRLLCPITEKFCPNPSFQGLRRGPQRA